MSDSLQSLLTFPPPVAVRRGRRLRDSQMGKVYAAERVLWERRQVTHRKPAALRVSPYGSRDVVTGGRLETLEDMQHFVNTVLHSRWYRTAYPRGPSYIMVAHGGGCGSARAVGHRRIEMPGWARCRLIVLHEMAHCIAPYARPSWCKAEPAHGRTFARVYLALVERWLGADMGRRLRDAYRAHKVRWCLPRRPGTGRTPGNPAALHAWREQQAATPKEE